MMGLRIWYPQLDVFDCVRRISILASLRDSESASLERLLIGDFFFASPHLIHSTSMPSSVREKFIELNIKKPEKVFLSYPAAPLLFHKMEPVQKHALNAMIARDLLDREKFEQRKVQLTSLGQSVFAEQFDYTDVERTLAKFIALDFMAIEQGSIQDLRRQTGLRRVST